MLSEKAITITKEGKLLFNFERIKKLTKKMMEEVVRIQIDQNIPEAEKYVNKWAVWTEEIEKVASTIRSYSKMLNGYLIKPLEDEFLKSDYKAK